MPRAFLRFTLLVFLLLAATAGANWDKKWDRIQVSAHLANDGSVNVVERMTATLEGDMDTLERPLSTGLEQAIVLRRLVREDSDGEQVLRDGDRREWDQYDFTNGVLTWGIRPPDGEWKGETIVFRVEYELRHALSPAWDFPMSQERFSWWGDFWDFPKRMRPAFTAWREAGTGVAKRYRYEHEVRFPPFRATGPRETNYTLKFDDAWRMVFPEREVGYGAEEFYRASLLMEYLPSGRPATIELWQPLVRVGSLLLAGLVVLGFSALWFIAEYPVRRLWRGAHRPGVVRGKNRVDPAGGTGLVCGTFDAQTGGLFPRADAKSRRADDRRITEGQPGSRRARDHAAAENAFVARAV